MVRIGKSALIVVASLPVLFAVGGASLGIRDMDAAKERWDRQVAVASLEGDIQYLNNIAEAATVREKTGDYESAKRDLYRQLQSIRRGEMSRELLEISAIIDAWVPKLDRVVELTRKGEYDQSRLMDSEEADPMLGRLVAVTHQLGHRLRTESDQQHARSMLLGLVGASASSLLASVLFIAYLRRAFMVHALKLDRESAEAGKRRLASLMRNNGDVIALLDNESRLTLVSGACENLWDRTPATLEGEVATSMCHPNDQSRFVFALKKISSDSTDLKVEVRVADGRGGYRPYAVSLNDLRSDPDVNGILATFHDLTERKAFQRELTHQAYHDPLTGLANRCLMLDKLGAKVERGRQLGERVAVMFLDLDNFKLINDTLGHDYGDKLLIAVSARLQSALQASDMLARIGGDEFVILLRDGADEGIATELARSLLTCLRAPIMISDREVFATGSIGIAVAAGRDADADALLREADTAMYHAKTRGKSNYAVFTPSMNEEAVERLELESDLRRALRERQLVVHYQPIVDMKSMKVREFEVLVRWQHPTRGLISPARFVPIAEETGLIGEIGGWVLREACRQVAAWNEQYRRESPIRMSVNVSGRQLENPGFVQEVAAVLKSSGVRPEQIELEITESVMLRDLDRSRDVLVELRELGVRIAIDDFGTGYSSMAYLSKLPINKLKIDRSFINALTDDHGEHIVRAIIVMAKTLGLKVTSEGVETLAQQRLLKRLGCELGQGFYFARPMAAPEIDHLLELESTGSDLKAA